MLRVAGANAFPRFRAIIDDAERLVGELAPAELPAAIGDVARLGAVLGVRLVSPLDASLLSRRGDPDRLLTATEAAQRLGIAVQTLYRRSAGYPFTVREGRALRFAARGIEEYIRLRGKS